jgi:hypothetical protein
MKNEPGCHNTKKNGKMSVPVVSTTVYNPANITSLKNHHPDTKDFRTEELNIAPLNWGLLIYRLSSIHIFINN